MKALSSEIVSLKRNVVSSKLGYLESFHTQFLATDSTRGSRPNLNDRTSPMDPPLVEPSPKPNANTEQSSGQIHKRNVFKSIWNFIFGSSDSQNLKTLQSNVKRLAENGLLRDQYISKMTESINLLQETQRENTNYFSQLSDDFVALNSTLSGSETITAAPSVTILGDNDKNNTKDAENKTETDDTEKQPIRGKVKNQVKRLNDLDKQQEEAMQFLEETYHADFSKYKNYRSKKAKNNRFD